MNIQKKNPMDSLTTPELEKLVPIYQEIRDGYPYASDEYKIADLELHRITMEISQRKLSERSA